MYMISPGHVLRLKFCDRYVIVIELLVVEFLETFPTANSRRP